MADVGILYYSMYGNTYAMAQQLQAGIERDGGSATLLTVPHLLPDEVTETEAVAAALELQADVPVAEVQQLPAFDGLLFGSGTRFGNMTGQLRNFLDQTGPLWAEGRLVGRTAGFFTGASTMHGGHEVTILTMSTYAFHHGMLIVPPGYAIAGNQTTRTGGGPYGPSHLSPTDGSKNGLSDEEIQIARDYGAHFHGMTARVAATA